MYALYGLISNASSIKTAINKFSLTYNNALSSQDRRLLNALERRVQSLVQPLNFILIQSGQNRILQSSNSTISTPSIRECLGLLNEV